MFMYLDLGRVPVETALKGPPEKEDVRTRNMCFIQVLVRVSVETALDPVTTGIQIRHKFRTNSNKFVLKTWVPC